MHIPYVMCGDRTSPMGVCPVIKHIVIQAEKEMNIHTKQDKQSLNSLISVRVLLPTEFAPNLGKTFQFS